MRDEHFIKHSALPFAECRYSENSERSYKPHMHQTFSVGAVEQGDVIYRVEGKTMKLQPGCLALVNPETLHSCNPPESSKRNYFMLHLDVAWCLQVQQSLWQVETFRSVRSPLLEDEPVYEKCMVALKLFMGQGDLLEKEQHLVELAGTIFRLACEPAAVIEAPSSKIQMLKEQLAQHLDRDVSLSQLSANLKTNPYTLLRRFKAASGITPHAYRMNCRIEHAKHLIREGADLSQVALECGFYDQSHFHRHFKAITAVTPREYQVNFIQ